MAKFKVTTEILLDNGKTIAIDRDDYYTTYRVNLYDHVSGRQLYYITNVRVDEYEGMLWCTLNEGQGYDMEKTIYIGEIEDMQEIEEGEQYITPLPYVFWKGDGESISISIEKPISECKLQLKSGSLIDARNLTLTKDGKKFEYTNARSGMTKVMPFDRLLDIMLPNRDEWY